MRSLVVLTLVLGLLVFAFVATNAIGPEEGRPTSLAEPLDEPERSGADATPEPSDDKGRSALTVESPGERIEPPARGAAHTIGLAGRLTESITGLPIPRCPLVFENAQEETFEVDTRGDGTFELAHRFAPGVLEVGVRAEDAEPELWLELDSDFLWLLPQDTGGQRFVELTGRAPTLVLEVWAVHPDPQMRESVVVSTRAEDAVRGWRIATPTEATGCARVAFFGDSATASATFSARGDANWVFGPLSVDPPLTKGPFELVPTRGAELEVLVVSRRGSPLVHARVRVDSSIPGIRFRESFPTGDDGQVRFEGLFPGQYDVSAVWSGRFTDATITVDAGTRNSSTIVIDVVGETVLLASGRIVDEHDEPMAEVRVGIDAYPFDVVTDAGGGFEVRGDAGELVLELAPHLPNARFEPSSLEVPAGATDLRFRCVSRQPERTVWIEVVDTQSDAVLRHAVLFVWTQGEDDERWTDSAHMLSWSRNGLDEDEPLTLEWDSFRWLVAHPGYRSLSGTAGEFLARESDDPVRGGKRIRFELERGILREVFVYADDDSEPILGALLSDSVGVLGTTDAEGFVLVDSERWPDRVDVACEGFRTARWVPEDDWNDWEPAEIWLERDVDR